ncbi:MAG: flavin reductase family protein [Oscillospiraceae bacterium]|nr:flavin reductase family protein [Oscillospiraceae bacterium]
MSENKPNKPQIEYGRKILNAGTLLAPLPAVMVSCGSLEKANVLTVAWTGIVNTKPPMTYISVRPTRHSYGIIKESGEFVINLTTSKMVRETDFCGVKSGKDTDKLKKCGLHIEAATAVSAPIVSESPLSLECRVVDIKPLGSHDMFLAEIVAVNVDGRYIDSKGKINLNQAGLMAYSHGEYFSLGRKLGSFGYSVARRSTKKDNRK